MATLPAWQLILSHILLMLTCFVYRLPVGLCTRTAMYNIDGWARKAKLEISATELASTLEVKLCVDGSEFHQNEIEQSPAHFLDREKGH